MKFNLEKGSSNIIHSYQPGELRLQQNLQQKDPETGEILLKTLTGSLILSPEALIEDWLDSPDDLNPVAIRQILELNPEVILLGTGEVMKFPDPAILQECHLQQVGVEVMNSAAACRTYNVLAAEGRRVCVGFVSL